MTEAILCWKYRKGTGHIQHDAPHRPIHWVGWVVAYGAMLVFWIYLRFKPDHTTKYPIKRKAVEVASGPMHSR